MSGAGDPGSGAAARVLACAAAEAALAPLTEAEFERLYEANAGPVLGYLIASTDRHDVADDLLQETFCRVLAHRAAMSQAGMDAAAQRRYLFRIATNLLRDRWRGREDQPFSEPAEAGESRNFEASIDVHAMLRHLKPRERELLWLAYVEGMDHAEIAAATGLNRLSVRTLLFRARSRAKQFFSAGREAQ